MHALDGHRLALFLYQAVDDALHELAELDQDAMQLLDILSSKDTEQQHRVMANMSIPYNGDTMSKTKIGWDPLVTEAIPYMFNGNTICRTARTPGQSRYLGYATNSEKVGGPAVLGNETYDVGIHWDEALALNKSDGSVPLVMTDNSKERRACKAVVKPDYPDFFFISEKMGKSKIVFPNPKEVAAYNYKPSDHQGYLQLILVMCPWGKCKGGEMRPQNFMDGDVSLKVNGQEAKIDIESGFLFREDGALWKPNKGGFYEFEFDVHKEEAFVRVSTLILY